MERSTFQPTSVVRHYSPTSIKTELMITFLSGHSQNDDGYSKWGYQNKNENKNVNNHFTISKVYLFTINLSNSINWNYGMSRSFFALFITVKNWKIKSTTYESWSFRVENSRSQSWLTFDPEIPLVHWMCSTLKQRAKFRSKLARKNSNCLIQIVHNHSHLNNYLLDVRSL